MADSKKIELKLPQQKASGFGIANLLGLIFVLVGVLFLLLLSGIKLPISLGSFESYLEYGAAIASIIGGISMLFRSKEINIIKK